MDVKQAIAVAKKYVQDIMADEQLSNIGLEEVEFDENLSEWHITIGFSRPWNKPLTAAQKMLGLQPEPLLKRSYKIVTVSSHGDVVSMKNGPQSSET